MKKIAIVFPHQLFDAHPALSKTRDVCLVEYGRFFTDFNLHKKKLLFHVESMRVYREELAARRYRVKYIKQGDVSSDLRLTRLFSIRDLKDIYVADLCDGELLRRLEKDCLRYGKRLHVLDSPSFLTSDEVLQDFFMTRKNLSMSSFYVRQRKRLDILVSGGRPICGKWSFDPENRKKLPKGLRIPEPRKLVGKPPASSVSRIVKEYGENPGSTDDFVFPVTRDQARQWLKDFAANRLRYFGDYEDSISTDSVFVFHSVLSRLLNVGLLTPEEVLGEVLMTADRNAVPINNLEGFVRQIIGWREYVRGAYKFIGEEQRKSNFWNCSNKLPSAFYDARTGIDPLDAVISRVLHHSYCHHIERLMILGNFMLLCEIHPDEVYR